MIFSKTTSTLLCSALALASIGCAPKDDDWVELFNGKDFSNFTQLGGTAKYEIVDGAIVGTSVPDSPNSFLATNTPYEDFILEWEFQVDDGLNSGVQFRSHSKAEYRDHRVHGYQFEMETSPRAWTGGIFDEARRGWLYRVDYNPEARAQPYDNNSWNKARIECSGNTVRTFLNGHPVAYLIDDPNIETKGFIAFQVHGIGKNKDAIGKQVRWKNIRITEKVEGKLTADASDIFIRNLAQNTLGEAEAQQGWSLLFDGQKPLGWKKVSGEGFPDFGWVVQDETLTIQATPKGQDKAGDIVTEELFEAFELQLEFKLTEAANSGIKYYVSDYMTNGKPRTLGLEYQVLDDEKHPDAKNGIDGNRTAASLYDLIPSAKKVHHYDMKAKVGEWNHARVVAQANGTVQHWLNGFKVVEYQRGSPEYRKLVAASKYKSSENFGEAKAGRILLQDHNDKVSYRSIKIRKL